MHGIIIGAGVNVRRQFAHLAKFNLFFVFKFAGAAVSVRVVHSTVQEIDHRASWIQFRV